MGIMLCSCEKEGGEADKGKLEGKWWITTKEEALFNGKVVNTASAKDAEFYGKALFENGNCTFEDLEYNHTYVGSYSYLGNVINVEGVFYAFKFHVVKLTSKEGIVDIYANEYSFSLPDDLSEGEVVGSFEGKEIYSDDYAYWYFSDKGSVVACMYDDDRHDFFDTIRLYFKAE